MTGAGEKRRPVAAGLVEALRILIERPLLQEGDEGFLTAWPWRRELQTFFAERAGWVLQFGPGVLRLNAHAPFPEGGRAMDGLQHPQDAALLAWALWYHESLEVLVGEARQFSLEEMAQAISEQASIDFTVYRNRQSLKRALGQLSELGGLRVIDGGAGSWEDGQGEEGGELLEFTPGVAYLIAPSPPRPDVPPAVRATRALLVGPALSRARDEEAYLALGPELQDQLEDALDWVLDLQGDHAALMMDTQSREGVRRLTLGRSARSSAAMLLIEAIRQERRLPTGGPPLGQDLHGRVQISPGRLYALMDRVREEHRARWGQFGLKDTARILQDVLDQWRQLGGIDDWHETPGGILIEAHLARYDSSYGSDSLLLTRPQPRRPASVQPRLTD